VTNNRFVRVGVAIIWECVKLVIVYTLLICRLLVVSCGLLVVRLICDYFLTTEILGEKKLGAFG
jgi:hypothetical protein